MAEDILILVEEKSSGIVIAELAKALGIARRVRVLTHDGLGDLKKSIPRKLNAEPYPSTHFIIVCDSDGKDCIERKGQLLDLVPKDKRDRTTIRIACHELEAWYLAQPAAVRKARVLREEIPKSIRARNPDSIANPKEAFMRIAHHRSGQMELARKIGPHLDPFDETSKSFSHTLATLRQVAKRGVAEK